LFGFLNIFKPEGMTSNHVISVLRRSLKIKQIGFAGTLDPLAEGVLPVAIGKSARLIDYLNSEKSYIATAKFGEISTTFDREGEITKIENAPLIKIDDIISKLKNFEGETKQKPPIYSAVHVNGKRLYELARKNIKEEEIEIPERTIFISKIELVEFNEEEQCAKILIDCSKGTYIRSIVSDLGEMLNSGGVMTNLKRINSSGFKIENSILPDKINTDNVNAYLISPNEVIDSLTIEITEKEFRRIRFGNSIPTDITSEKPIFIKYEDEIIALAKTDKGLLIPQKVFI